MCAAKLALNNFWPGEPLEVLVDRAHDLIAVIPTRRQLPHVGSTVLELITPRTADAAMRILNFFRTSASNGGFPTTKILFC